jgi:hypothetical protein
MTEKSKLITEAEEEFTSFKRALSGLTEGQWREVWCGAWSVREIVGHISGWQREMGQALERMGRGEKPLPAGVSYDDVDAWNTRFAAAAQALSTDALLGGLEASHAAFMRAAQALPEERLVPGKTAYKIVDLNSRHHYQGHRDEILAWRKSRGL